MATESDLRDLLRDPEPERRPTIDVDAVLGRARRRRRPRVIAAQALGSVALVGVLGTAVFVAGPLADRGQLMTAGDAGAEGIGEETAAEPYVDTDVARWMPDACGAAATDPEPSPGLTLELSPGAAEPTGRIPVTVTLRNDGPDRILGTSGTSPHVSLARDGVVVWHSWATQDTGARVIDLAPGAAMSFDSFAEAAICADDDDLITGDPQNDLPPAPPGAYQLRAVLVVTTDAGPILLAASPPVALQIAG